MKHRKQIARVCYTGPFELAFVLNLLTSLSLGLKGLIHGLYLGTESRRISSNSIGSQVVLAESLCLYPSLY